MASCPEKLFLSVALMATLISLSANGFCRADETPVTESELVTILRATKVVPADSILTASISGEEIVVTTNKKDGATDDAAKIEAVLIAKTVFDSVKNDAQRAKIILFDSSSDGYSEIAVKRAEVKMFGSGQLSEKELLSSLEIKKGDGETADDDSFKAAPGPYQSLRVVLNLKLKQLEKKGSNVSDLWSLFDKMEETARSKDSDGTKAKCLVLENQIKDREIAFRMAHQKSERLDKRISAKQNGFQTPPTSDHLPPPLPLSGGESIAGRSNTDGLAGLMQYSNGHKMYAFSEGDITSSPFFRAKMIHYYLRKIHDNAMSGVNVQSDVSSMNAAIEALKSGNKLEFDNNMNPIKKRYGLPSLGHRG